jgi:hypothetical protein
MQLYDTLIAHGCRVANHESDLYVEATAAAHYLIAGAISRGELRTIPQIFRSDDPADRGARFYDIPFAYAPFWRQREARQ